MRRFEVYFLQKKVEGVWETLERSQSVTVLVASLVREFDAREDVEVRILAGTYDETASAWDFTQIFFVDRSAIELALVERAESEEPSSTSEHGDRSGSFADAIRRASGEEPDDRTGAEADGNADEEEDVWAFRDRAAARRIADRYADDTSVGPPPTFRQPRRSSGRAFFMIGVILIALVLSGAAILALMIAFDVPQVRPLLSTIREYTSQMQPGGAEGSAAPVMPQTGGQVVTHRGVSPSLRGRWSPGRCEETYIEFDAEGLVVGAPGRPESLKVPVVETLEDDYTWYVRRSPDLVEHFQKLGANDMQLVGDTTRAGFSPRTSDVLTRCP